MAKRRKLETPSAEDLTRIEEEFRRETSAPSTPITPPRRSACKRPAPRVF